MSKAFKFKEFTVHQDRCAMKVGTDGVLLGAWASLEKRPKSILDIGAGTGVVALILAQRSKSEIIDAIEIEELAYEQCVENFEASSWADRLFCYHADLEEFVEEMDEPYDLIVSNPPFYSEVNEAVKPARSLARQRHSLPFEMLLESIAILLSKQGNFSTIIPFKEENSFLKIAALNNLYPFHITRVRGNKTATIKRSLITFQFKNDKPTIGEITIENKRHEYTMEYRALTEAFYLRM